MFLRSLFMCVAYSFMYANQAEVYVMAVCNVSSFMCFCLFSTYWAVEAEVHIMSIPNISCVYLSFSTVSPSSLSI